MRGNEMIDETAKHPTTTQLIDLAGPGALLLPADPDAFVEWVINEIHSEVEQTINNADSPDGARPYGDFLADLITRLERVAAEDHTFQGTGGSIRLTQITSDQFMCD